MYWLSDDNRESIKEYRMRMKSQEDYDERLERIEKQKQEKMIKKQEEMIAAETWKAFDEVSDLNDDMKREIRKFLY